MKHIIFFLLMVFPILLISQPVTCNLGETTVIGTINAAGGDTVLPFRFQSDTTLDSYSIEAVVTDTIEGSNIGLTIVATDEVKPPNYKTYYRTITNFGNVTDSLKIDTMSFPQHKFFIGEKFPFYTGGVLVHTNGATEGTVKLQIRPY